MANMQIDGRKKIDYAIHVKSSKDRKGILFEYGISKSPAEVMKGSKSKYYPVEISQVMAHVREIPGSYVFVGLPCFVKAVRLLAIDDSILNERIRYTIALVCGHLKTDRFAKAMAWEMGIHPEHLVDFGFRVKHANRQASNYDVEAKGQIDGKMVGKRACIKDLFCSDWGRGFFKLNACDYCDDVIGETADVSIGDAWLPRYIDDSEGTNIVTVRHPEVLGLLERHMMDLHLNDISIDEVIQSQAGGFRHRREGLAYRLYLKDRFDMFRPQKRVKASADICSRRKKVYEVRSMFVSASEKAYQRAIEVNDFNTIRQSMSALLSMYSYVNREGIVTKVKRRIGIIIGVFSPLKRLLRRIMHR